MKTKRRFLTVKEAFSMMIVADLAASRFTKEKKLTFARMAKKMAVLFYNITEDLAKGGESIFERRNR